MPNGFWRTPQPAYATISEVAYGAPITASSTPVSEGSALSNGEIVGVVIGTVAGALIMAAVASAITAVVVKQKIGAAEQTKTAVAY